MSPTPPSCISPVHMTVTVTSRVVAIALGFSPIGVIKHASRLND